MAIYTKKPREAASRLMAVGLLSGYPVEQARHVSSQIKLIISV